MIRADTERMPPPMSAARAVKSCAWAARLIRGSSAATTDTVITECGRMKIRWALVYDVRPPAVVPFSAARTLAVVASRTMTM